MPFALLRRASDRDGLAGDVVGLGRAEQVYRTCRLFGRTTAAQGVELVVQLEHFGVDPFTSHDLRRTAATRMEEIGISPFIVAHVLGHVSVTKASITSKVYARYEYEKEKQEAVEKWAAHLRGLIEGDATVLPFSGRK